MDTNVPAIAFTPTGLVLPDEGDVLNGVFADMATAFGGMLSQSLSSPQGQLAQSFSAIIGDKNDDIAEVVNNIDPDTASGRFQDAIGRIYFLDRIAASGTLVTATCGGLIGATIPAGSIAQDVNGYTYASLADAVIDATGTVRVQFQCLTYGPIACPIGALARIYKAVTGWETVTNLTAGTPGTNVESRADFEYRRRRSVAVNGNNSAIAVRGAVLSVPNVLDAYVVDNPTGAVVNTGATAYPVAAHSIYVCVAGGDPAAVATAIWSKKSIGCDYNGTTSYTLYDQTGGIQPYPSYVVRWVTPAALPIFFKVALVASPQLPADIANQVRAVIAAAFNGSDGGARARIGSTIYAGRYYQGVSAIDPSVEINAITVGKTTNPAGTSVAVGVDQLPTLDPVAQIQVVVS